MTLKELRDMTMFQLGMDEEDAKDFEPYLTDYLNEGYERLIESIDKERMKDYSPMELANEEPYLLIETVHRAMADWATWRICLCGNATRQQKGMMFLDRFEEVRKRMLARRSDFFVNWE